MNLKNSSRLIICLLLCLSMVLPIVACALSPSVETSEDESIYDYPIIEDCILDSFVCDVSDDGLFVVNAEISENGKKYCLDFDGQFFLFGPEYIPVCNKAIGNIHSSNYQILNFSVSRCNDMYSHDIVIEQGQALIKIAFVSPEDKTAVSVKYLTELSNYPSVREFVLDDANIIALDAEIAPALAATEHWYVPFIEENRIHSDNAGDTIASDSTTEDLFGIDADIDDAPIIEEFIYQPNGEAIRK